MLTPVVCFGCGTSIGHVAELFRLLRERRIREELKAKHLSPEMSAIPLDSSMDLQDLFDKLQIPTDCCRVHLSSAIVMSDHY
jgi:DNA-directed RNA polymerase subunit N (RpoN/RPB10)